LAKEPELNTVELLLAQPGNVSNIFQLAVGKNHLETLLTLCVWAGKLQLNSDYLKNVNSHRELWV
jgi:hypothetical protein